MEPESDVLKQQHILPNKSQNPFAYHDYTARSKPPLPFPPAAINRTQTNQLVYPPPPPKLPPQLPHHVFPRTYHNPSIPIVPEKSALNGEIERLRTQLREKELYTVRLKHENMALKQFGFRQQKEIESLEAEYENAPRLIENLKLEVMTLRARLKTSWYQHVNDDRSIRHKNEEIRKLSEHNRKYQRLVEEEELGTRHVLTDQLKKEQETVEKLEKTIEEMKRKMDLTEKNILFENKQIRSKMVHLENENTELKTSLAELEDTMKEKDKEIASLSIYRYNAVHRKIESLCKVCQRRQKEECEKKRREEIFERLPMLNPPSVVPVNANLVEVRQTYPIPKEDLKLTQICIYYKQVNAPAEEKASICHIDLPEKQIKVNGSDDLIARYLIDNLQRGETYVFRTSAVLLDVEGRLSEPSSVVVDILPSSPPPPAVTTFSNPPSVYCRLYPSPDNGCSLITHYRLYYSTSESFKDPVMITELNASCDTFMWMKPLLIKPMCFFLSAVNKLGESPPSKASECCVIDIPPSQLGRPQVQKMTSTSVIISIPPPIPNEGSDITSFKITYLKQKTPYQQEGEEDIEDQDLVILKIMDPKKLSHEVQGLQGGYYYRFQVTAVNRMGDGPPSELSDPIRLDHLYPVAIPPEIHIINATTVEVCFHDNETSYLNCPPILYRDIVVSDEPRFINPESVVSRLPFSQTSYTIDKLDEGETYFFAMRIGGEQSMGALCETIAMPMAAAFPVPETPPSNSGAQESIKQSSSNQLNNHSASASQPLGKKHRGSSFVVENEDISFQQKISNMHRGLPALSRPDLFSSSLQLDKK